MGEFGAAGEVQQPGHLRHVEVRRGGEQEIVGERPDGADRAVGTVPVAIVVGRRLDGRIGQAGQYRRLSANDLGVKMPERQRELDRERQQRQPRAGFHVFSEPVHDAFALPDESNRISRCYNITSIRAAEGQLLFR